MISRSLNLHQVYNLYEEEQAENDFKPSILDRSPTEETLFQKRKIHLEIFYFI